MSARIFTSNVVLNEPGNGFRTFLIGEEVPDWAIVGEHATQGVTKAAQTPAKVETSDDPGTPAGDATDSDIDDDDLPYEEWPKADLRAEVDGRELGVAKRATVEELVAALKADDLENPED